MRFESFAPEEKGEPYSFEADQHEQKQPWQPDVNRWRENYMALLPGGERLQRENSYLKAHYDLQYECAEQQAKQIANAIEEHDGTILTVARLESPEACARLALGDYKVVLDRQRNLRERHSLAVSFQEGTGFTPQSYIVSTPYGTVEQFDAYFKPERTLDRDEYNRYVGNILMEMDPAARDMEAASYHQEMEHRLGFIRAVMDRLTDEARQALRSYVDWNEDRLTGRGLDAMKEAGFLSAEAYEQIQAAAKDTELRVMGGSVFGYHRRGEERDAVEYRAVCSMEKKGSMPFPPPS